MYYIGVIVRMLLVFDPVSDEDLERVNPDEAELIDSLFTIPPDEAKKSEIKRLTQVDIEGHDDRTGLAAFYTPVGMLDFAQGVI